ncbi:PRO41 [Fusarium pseudoanthophilum]|uniref:PRO41 n=1 Tax=Fusarium pseudoanthophilum TaxID=48495 RepID=A0A8H5KU09_9HYPO|nr:PRO41 [Fusarium pseudoanthophilum]
MGKLIKNHWARLIILSAAAYQIVAAIECFFWPKIFWDFLTRTLDGAVRPVPALQIINLLLGIAMLALEWPLNFVAGSALHRSLEFRLAILPLTALSAALIYQGTNAAIYYLIGMIVYFWGYSEGEMICAKPWTLPNRGRSGGAFGDFFMIYDHQTIRPSDHQTISTAIAAFAFSICMIIVEVLVDEDTIGEGRTVYGRFQRNVLQSGDKEMVQLCSLDGPEDFRQESATIPGTKAPEI